jgi:hypothetical protein
MESPLRILLAVLLLGLGVIWPMVSLLWLSARLNRTPPLSSRRAGFIIAVNGVFPMSLVLSAFGLLLPDLRASLAYKGVLLVAWATTLVLFAGLWWAGATKRSAASDEKG